jgi:hypothetical protein
MSSNVSNYPAPQPPHKRRKLARNRPSPTSQSTPARVPTTTNTTNKLTTISIPICSSCHRALNVTSSNNIQCCARCVCVLDLLPMHATFKFLFVEAFFKQMSVYYMCCMFSYMHSISCLSTTNTTLDVVNNAVSSRRRFTTSFGVINKLSKHERYFRCSSTTTTTGTYYHY